MKQENKRSLFLSLCLLASFVLWTVLVCILDVKPIGPKGSSVGLATINGAFHSLTGVHMTLYTITDWLGLVPIAVALGFGILGLCQWIRRKHIAKVDFSILALGGFYVIVIAVYILFERVVINHRPVLINGFLEVSYPSSTTLLVMCVMPTAMMQFYTRIKNQFWRKCVTCIHLVFILFTVLGRLISGVHWLSDIIGGALLSAGLVLFYRFMININNTL